MNILFCAHFLFKLWIQETKKLKDFYIGANVTLYYIIKTNIHFKSRGNAEKEIMIQNCTNCLGFLNCFLN